MLDKNNWRRRVFDRGAQGCPGYRTIRIHDLRHTYATLRISKGDNIADVSGQLGHHSVKLTLDVYLPLDAGQTEVGSGRAGPLYFYALRCTPGAPGRL